MNLCWTLIVALIGFPILSVRAADVRHVVLITIDGLPASAIDDPRAKLPTLRAIRAGGASAAAMITTFPSVTGPAHVSLSTGVRPKTHGVLANSVFDRRTGQAVNGQAANGEVESSSSGAQVIAVPTLYDAGHEAGLKTAAVLWPWANGTRSLDWIVPDVASAKERVRLTTPGLAAEMAAMGIHTVSLDSWGRQKFDPVERDALAAQIACFLLQKKRVNLLLVHLNAADYVEHSVGPNADAAYQAFAGADRSLKPIWTTLKKPAFASDSTLFIVSDHGFSPYDKLIEPNVVLARLGLVGVNLFGNVTRREAWSLTLGGAAYVYLFGDQAAARSEEIATKLKSLEGIECVLEPATFERLGLPDPRENPRMPQLILIARPGFCFDERMSGEVIIDAGGRKGTHGQRPESPAMWATFVAAGAHIKPGVRLKSVDIIDVAPTIAQLLGIRLPTSEGHPLNVILAE